MPRMARRQIFRVACLTVTAASLLLLSSGCGSGSGTIPTGTRYVPVTYTNLQGDPTDLELDYDGIETVATLNAADVPGSPRTLQLSYTLTGLNGKPLDYNYTGPSEATLRQGRYRFFLSLPPHETILRIALAGASVPVSLPPMVRPAVFIGSAGPGTGIPIFTTNTSGNIVVAAASNTAVTLTVDASSIAGSPDVVSVTYSGPISGPAQVTKSGEQYVIEATTGTVTSDTPTSVTLNGVPGYNTGDGPTVQPQP